MIKVKPLVKFEILLQAHGLHSTGQQADHCLVRAILPENCQDLLEYLGLGVYLHCLDMSKKDLIKS